MKDSRRHHCSFCNEAESSTRRVLVGPGQNVGICSECVTFSQQVLCNSVAAERRDEECSFCGKTLPLIEKLAFGPGVNICSKCIAFARQQLDGSGSAPAHEPGALGRGLITRLRSLLRSGRTERVTTAAVWNKTRHA